MKKIKDYKFLKTFNKKYNINEKMSSYHEDTDSGLKLIFTKSYVYIFLVKETIFNIGLKKYDNIYKDRTNNKNLIYIYNKILDINKKIDSDYIHNLSKQNDIFPDFYNEDENYIVFRCNSCYKKIYSFEDCLKLVYYNDAKDIFYKKILNLNKEDTIKKNISKLLNFKNIKIDKSISLNDVELLIYGKETNNNIFIDEFYLNFINHKHIYSFCLADRYNNFKIISLDHILYIPLSISQTIEMENL